MYAIYNNYLYDIFHQGAIKLLGTHKKAKCIQGFIEDDDCYIRDMSEVVNEIDSIFDVKYYVTYTNKTKTIRGKRRWQVSETVPLHRGFDIEKNEVGICTNGMRRSSDWIQFDSCACSKIVDISECTDFTVRYEYSRKDGVDFEEPLIEEREVSAEEFKRIMVSYRIQNI